MIKDLQILEHKNSVATNVTQSNLRSTYGKSTVDVLCPFCENKTNAYIWSLSGGGKRCSSCKDVLLTSGMAFMRFKTLEQTQLFYEANKDL